MNRRQAGLTTVEFAVIGAVLMTLMFGVFEFGRLFYSYAVLNEGMRRAARLATVCPIDSPGIRDAAEFAGLPDFRGRNVQVQYLNAFGFPTFDYTNISYVRTRLVGYTLRLSIPFIDRLDFTPTFDVTLPRESLGVTPTSFANCN
jgi:TadE-like protein